MFVINGVVADTRVVKEAATLAEAGHEVTVLGMREGSQPAREDFQGFAIVRVRADPFRREVVGKSGVAGPLGRALAPLREALGILDYSLRAAGQGVRRRADVYHAHDLITLPAAWAASCVRGAALVYDAHELFTEIGRLGRPARAVLRIVERMLIGRADRVMTVNESIADELARRYGVPRPAVLMNCPRTGGRVPAREESALRARAGVPAGEPIVLFQGMFMPHRGLENLVRAVALFHRGHLVFMGWGALRTALERLASAEGSAHRIHFTDGVPLSELLAYTAGADLGVIPYRNVGLNNYYTSPNKLFEYCAAGVPVVSSRFPELVKVVEGWGVGRTFDPERPEEIAQAVNALLDFPEDLARARANAIRAAQRFNWETECRTLLEVYAAVAPSEPAA